MKTKFQAESYADGKVSADETVQDAIDPAGAMLDIEDEALASVAGGCGCPGGATSALCSPCPPRDCF
ncbi:mersacidin/lichenicidin family type 2 lantibiotic [Eilatimonas milleporae]|uniref:Uncharacterized protein n=1 Tax=Eilatimonas milleporae TaxID=911205 RepID=A0A3M0CBQ3_9PROT|nr:mersacidin/lichenicidin family type 2 lantibiotic [Eilatimonas milleporae]RMB04449.1 hypothetical protein BXY39_2711 [Eilatimonas milleporae]